MVQGEAHLKIKGNLLYRTLFSHKPSFFILSFLTKFKCHNVLSSVNRLQDIDVIDYALVTENSCKMCEIRNINLNLFQFR